MPTFTAIALENLLEPRVGESLKKPEAEGPNGRPRHLYISPALYATPEQSPIPDFSLPDPPSPSPYVANRKRRSGGTHARVPEMCRHGDATEDFGVEEAADNFVNDDVSGVTAEDDGFLDPRSDVASELDAEAADLSHIQIGSRSFVSAQGEFFDAIDEFSSDGSMSNTPSCEHRLQSELHASRLSLLEEIEKRKTAEETLLLMRSQWEKIRSHMSEAGLTFPAPPAIHDNMQLEEHMMDKMSQEVVVAKFVAEVVGRGLARAEAEESALSIVESKDQEILRLRDRLQYYETVNHEMSQRKLVEVARRQQKRKSRRRWVWSLMGLAVAVGASSLAAYSCTSHTSECLESGDSSYSSIVSSETTSQGQ